jgi:elongation factor Ts
MADITAETVKTLRDRTNAGMMDCKKALSEANGDLEAAETILRKKGILKAGSKADRATKEGIIASYIHMQGRVGVLIEVNCETDFVAKNDNFRDFVKDLTLHIAAASPICVSRDQVPEKILANERDIAADQVKGKPAAMIEKIVEGKIEKIYSTMCLMEQAFIKNPDQTITDFVKSKIAELGENIQVRRFVRYAVGEEVAGA